MFQKTTRSSSKLAKIFLRQKIVKRNYSLPPQQLSYVKGEVHPPLLEKTMGQCWEEAVSKYSTQEHLVVVHENSRFTWLELKKQVDSFAAGLLKLGLKTGDRLGVWMPNNSEWIIAKWACWRLGIILVNVNPAYRENELIHAINLVGCKALIVVPTMRASNYLEMLQKMFPELHSKDTNKFNLTLQKAPTLQVIIQTSSEEIQGMIKFKDVFLSTSKESIANMDKIGSTVHFKDPINIQFTSGTTGLPKAAALSSWNILNNGYFSGERMRLTPSDSLCLPVPLYHCFGLVLGNLACVTHGAKLVYPSAGFDAEATLRAIAAEKCTAVHGVPTMFINLLDLNRKLQLPVHKTLRTGLMAGSTCPIEIMKRVISEMNCREVLIAYGLTECSPVIFHTSIEDSIERRVETVGSIFPHVEAKVIDPVSGTTVPINTPGELCARGYLVMRGYWPLKENHYPHLEGNESNGFFRTGDIAEIDEHGYCRIVGRQKDIIIRGGENIAPREVEEFLFTHDKVKDVAVVGIPDLKYGEQVCAFIIKKDASLTEEEVMKHCEAIAHFKRPHKILFVDAFPLTVTGKIQKYLLRDKAVKTLNLQSVAEQVKKQKIVMSN